MSGIVPYSGNQFLALLPPHRRTREAVEYCDRLAAYGSPEAIAYFQQWAAQERGEMVIDAELMPDRPQQYPNGYQGAIVQQAPPQIIYQQVPQYIQVPVHVPVPVPTPVQQVHHSHTYDHGNHAHVVAIVLAALSAVVLALALVDLEHEYDRDVIILPPSQPSSYEHQRY